MSVDPSSNRVHPCPECGQTGEHKFRCSRREGQGAVVPADMIPSREAWQDDPEFLAAWGGYSDNNAFELAQDAVDADRRIRHATRNSAAIEAAARRMQERCGVTGITWDELEHEGRVRWRDRAEDVLAAAERAGRAIPNSAATVRCAYCGRDAADRPVSHYSCCAACYERMYTVLQRHDSNPARVERMTAEIIAALAGKDAT